MHYWSTYSGKDDIFPAHMVRPLIPCQEELDKSPGRRPVANLRQTDCGPGSRSAGAKSVYAVVSWGTDPAPRRAAAPVPWSGITSLAMRASVK
jgi:hypothetical protein